MTMIGTLWTSWGNIEKFTGLKIREEKDLTMLRKRENYDFKRIAKDEKVNLGCQLNNHTTNIKMLRKRENFDF